jgi:hypothetical protein
LAVQSASGETRRTESLTEGNEGNKGKGVFRCLCYLLFKITHQSLFFVLLLFLLWNFVLAKELKNLLKNE